MTGFFRDPAAFDALTGQVVPALLRDRPPDQPLRIWVVGCSTGEEAYSLAILFHEGIAAASSSDEAQRIKLQVFASDIDADAVTVAREGLYPATIAANMSAERLSQFFSKEGDQGYRVVPELRETVMFAVQDLLTDPPFSRLDFMSCRNLMIYLRADAQARATALFHFALNKSGFLLLGSSEGVGGADDRFELVQKSGRLYRRVDRQRPDNLDFLSIRHEPRLSRPSRDRTPSRQTVLAELCRQAVLEAHAPAAVLCDARYECLYSLGPIDRYLRVPPGHVTSNLLAMARGTMRTQLRSALAHAARVGTTVTVPGGSIVRDGDSVPFGIEVRPLFSEGKVLSLVCFLDLPPQAQGGQSAGTEGEPRIAELEGELEAMRAGLEAAHHLIDASSEDQRTINEEAQSINEQFQTTNEELLTSKEELQSLNEELKALNSQLQETLERQRTTSDDLQNILYSTDVATLFLDRELCIRFFTPATRAVFPIIPGDMGRPLADLHSLAANLDLSADARAVLQTLQLVEREVETPGGIWFRCRILPYRTHAGEVEGVVLTLSDITQRKQEAVALSAAKQNAEAADRAKSRFLAAASHDLRQPLQTLALLQNLLASAVKGGKAEGLVQRMEDTLNAAMVMLNTLLDLNQIETGTIQTEVVEYGIGRLLNRLGSEFSYLAREKGLALRVVPCSAVVRTDPRLLEQMVRNLLSNALKYTERGRVLLGCRRTGDSLQVEVWDTGIGIPDGELQAVFQEYYQVGNEARERARGLGLGLSIVQRLGALLGHRVLARSQPGSGSVFSIGIPLAADAALGAWPAGSNHVGNGAAAVQPPRRVGTILVIEDDPDMRDVLCLLLRGQGHAVAAAPDGPTALDMVAGDAVRPGLVLADYNLPGGMTGLQVAGRLREMVPDVSVIILTGDSSVGKLHDVAQQGCMHLNKPVKPADLLQTIQDLLPVPSVAPVPRAQVAATRADAPVIFVVDDDSNIRAALRSVLEETGYLVEDYPDGDAFLAAYRPGRRGCLLVDAAMPGTDGLEVLRRLNEAGHRLPAIVITGHGDVAMAVSAMKAGALEFVEKPVNTSELLLDVSRAIDQARDIDNWSAIRQAAVGSIASLTPQQYRVMQLVLAGHANKNIAAELNISQRTVETHRASIMRKTGVRSLPALARLAMVAAAADGKAAGGLFVASGANQP